MPYFTRKLEFLSNILFMILKLKVLNFKEVREKINYLSECITTVRKVIRWEYVSITKSNNDPCYVIKRKSFTKTRDIDKKLKLILSGKNCRTTTVFLLSMLNNFSHNKVTSTFYQIKNMPKVKMLSSRNTMIQRYERKLLVATA